MSQAPKVRPRNFAAIRREAEAAARDFLENRWDAYLKMVRKVEASRHSLKAKADAGLHGDPKMSS